MAEFDTTNATATADDILSGKTAYAKGEKIKGTIQSKLGGAFTPTAEPQIICPAGVYTSSAFSVKGDANLKPTNIRKGVEIFGVEGTMRGNDTPSGTLPDDVRTISVEPNDYKSGTVYGGGGVSKGMVVTVGANPIGRRNFFGWEENGGTVSEDAEYTFKVEKSRNLKAVFGDTHKPLPDGYTEVEWIQNVDRSSYINTGKACGTSLYLEISFPNGKAANLNHVIEGGTGIPYLCTNPTFHWYYYAGSGTSSFLTQRTLSAGSEIDDITKINMSRQLSSLASMIMINGTVNLFSNTSSVNISGITIPSSAPSSSQIIRIHYIKGADRTYSGKAYNFELIPCISPQNVVGLYDVVNNEFIAPARGRFITVYDGNFYTISLTNSNPQWGEISGDGTYEEGASVTVTAEPNDGFKFVAWKENGEVVSNSATYTFTSNSNRDLVAEFAARPSYLISASIEPDGSGGVAGAGRYYENESVSLQATPNSMYKFSRWKEGGGQVSANNPYTFTAESNRSLVAEFVDKLPAGYTEVEYIQSGGKAVINTLVKPTANTKLVMDVEPLETNTSNDLYFFRSGITGYSFQATWAKSGVVFLVGNSSTTYIPNSNTNPRRMILTLDAKNKLVSVDSASKAVSNNTMSTSMINIMLLAYNATGVNGLPANLYSCKIYSNNILVRDFVPCVNSEGVAGMYDSIEDAFYPSASSTAFTAGPIVK